jgi:hypothetical protein
MVRSVRFDPELDGRLEQAAQIEGVPVSALIREAVARRCDEVLGRTLHADLAAVIGAIESERGRAEHTGEAFRRALAARTRTRG